MIRIFVPVAIVLAGCSTPIQRTYPHVDQSHLWTAMVATADSPEYGSEDLSKRWIVLENEVEINPSRGQIDVKRIIYRSYQLPRQKPERDSRDVLFSVYLLPTNPLTLEFINHNATFFPVRGKAEAQRFFDGVDQMLVPIID
ncbi:MAG: hypothetical protein H8E91_06485 [Planctomycetes bacterium]|nr:hypothetical protein [Planctomycetota bacterium]